MLIRDASVNPQSVSFLNCIITIKYTSPKMSSFVKKHCCYSSIARGWDWLEITDVKMALE